MVKGIIIPTEAIDPMAERDVVAPEDYQAVVDGWTKPVHIHPLGITVLVHEESCSDS
ncbi:hypothetical protein ACTJI8_09830 [Microbacterium sp. 22303]|uniref:hypothetical protein n=1 Tax=Microbacterium sp. 22303 TaxID=3453905 RepID=UPI003F85176A